MRNVLIPVICLFLGLAAGYMFTAKTTAVEVTPAMIEEGIRENPRLVLDLLRQYPEEVFDVVIMGQEAKRKKARDEQIAAQLLDPLVVEYAPDRPVRGSKDAPVTIVEFSDFQCPHCAKASEIVKELVEKHPGELKQVFLHFPLSSHQLAPLAAAYFEAASLQDTDKAWQLHDLVFANQKDLQEKGPAWLRETAESLGLDMEQLDKDLASEAVRGRLQADMKAVEKLGLRGTPSYIIGGVLISGALPEAEFLEIIDMVKEHQASAGAPAPKVEEKEQKAEQTPPAEDAEEQAAAPKTSDETSSETPSGTPGEASPKTSGETPGETSPKATGETSGEGTSQAVGEAASETSGDVAPQPGGATQ